MAAEINLGGTIYISSRRGAEIMGYTQDYVGQLARSGAVKAQRISGLWYVTEESLRSHKEKADEYIPEPPQKAARAELETSVSFDGRDYVLASRAAKLTGYHQDYVGQLARSGKINSRQIGARWYVDRDALIAHKKHNDALLAAVQAESVGLGRSATFENNSEDEEVNLHFNYVPQTAVLGVESSLISDNGRPPKKDIHLQSASDTPISSSMNIPIRIISSQVELKDNILGSKRQKQIESAQSSKKNNIPRYVVLIVFLLFLSPLIYLLGHATIFRTVQDRVLLGRDSKGNVLVVQNNELKWRYFLKNVSISQIQGYVSKELVYQRN
jgi:hypothetical protein